MARLPFDPDRMAGPPDDPGARPAGARQPREAAGERADLGPGWRDRQRMAAPGAPQQLTVTQAAELIKNALEQRIASPLRVVGEVSNLSARNHWYFSLKDDASILHCVAWATAARKFNFTPKDGDAVVAAGHISHYGPQGRTQLYVSDLVPVGAGALDQRFRALCEELRRLGYFDEARKRPLPILPRRVAVITSAGGAAVHDVVTTAGQRCRAVAMLIIDVRVQGERAARHIAQAIRWVSAERQRLGVDAMLLTRGGGSIEDLWAFNERVVADAILACALPVVAAIGHESDTTIAELVADVRASTPTQAAMRLVPAAVELCRHIEHLSKRMGFLLARLLERQRHRLQAAVSVEIHRQPHLLVRRRAVDVRRFADDLGRIAAMRIGAARARLGVQVARLVRHRPEALLATRRARLEVLHARLARAAHDRAAQRPRLQRLAQELELAIGRRLQRLGRRNHAAAQHLRALDPHGVLERGYSITLRPGGQVIRSARQIGRGDPIITRVADGSFDSIVGGSPRIASRSAVRRKSGSRVARTDEQLDLFASDQ